MIKPMPKPKEKIKYILVENMLNWKATNKVSQKEFDKLLKQILELFEEEKAKWAEEIIKEIESVLFEKYLEYDDTQRALKDLRAKIKNKT